MRAFRLSIMAVGLMLCLTMSCAQADDACLKEFVWMSVDAYASAGCALGDCQWYDFVGELKNLLATEGGWQLCCGLRDSSVLSEVLESPVSVMDEGDLAIWTGHSYLFEEPAVSDRLHMASQHAGATCESGRDCGNVVHAEIRLGASDNEVGIFVTCEWLCNKMSQSMMNEIKMMHQGNHLILSFATTSSWNANDVPAATRLSWNFLGKNPGKLPVPIEKASRDACDYWPPANVVARVHLWAGNCYNDYLQGNWKGWSYGSQPPAANSGNLNQFGCISEVCGNGLDPRVIIY